MHRVVDFKQINNPTALILTLHAKLIKKYSCKHW